MAIPYYILGIVYLGALLMYFVMAFFNVYHMIRFGFFDFVGKIHTLLLACIVALIVFFTILFLRNVNWLDSFVLFDNNSDTEYDSYE